MSVIVKGMEIPEDCFSCRLKEEGFCNLTDKVANDIYKRNDDCPLVELSEKHGRLIDADVLIDDCKKYLNRLNPSRDGKECTRIHWLIGVLSNAPTIEPERKTGKWIYSEHDVAMCDGYRCNKCGFFVPWDYKHKSIDYIKDYHCCPNCYAYMKCEPNVD